MSVPDKHIEKPTHYQRDRYESNINMIVKPNQIIAVRIIAKIEWNDETKQIVEAAKKRCIPVYNKKGERVWPPIEK